MERLKGTTILLLVFTVGLVVVASTVFGLIAPTAWMRFRWHGLTTPRRGFKEEDLNSIGGRSKILFFNVVFLFVGLSIMFIAGWSLLQRLDLIN